MDWGAELLDQLEWHWDNQLRDRLEGLTDEEYFWEPVPGWNVRRRGTALQRPDEGYVQVGGGEFVIDFAFPEPTPPPFTTIAWRLCHIADHVLAKFEKGETADLETFIARAADAVEMFAVADIGQVMNTYNPDPTEPDNE